MNGCKREIPKWIFKNLDKILFSTDVTGMSFHNLFLFIISVEYCSFTLHICQIWNIIYHSYQNITKALINYFKKLWFLIGEKNIFLEYSFRYFSFNMVRNRVIPVRQEKMGWGHSCTFFGHCCLISSNKTYLQIEKVPLNSAHAYFFHLR